MSLPNRYFLTLGFFLVGLFLQSIPAYCQEFGWARQFGGIQTDIGVDVTADAAGNIYVIGYFTDIVDFDPGPGVANLTAAGGNDIFVVKLDSAGSLIWARGMGGADQERPSNIAVDSNGNVHTTGWFRGAADFDPGPGVANLTAVGDYTTFISKLDSAGNFVWAKSLGAAGYGLGDGIEVDAVGNVFTAGYFSGAGDFDPGAGVFTMTPTGDQDIFVSKLDSSGNFLWARHMGGSSEASAYSLALDANGNVHLTGNFGGTVDFDPNAGTANLTAVGDDIFVCKLDAAGNFLWARQFGGTDSDYGNDITVDSGGNVLTTGFFGGTADFDPGAGVSELSSVGNSDVFVSKLDAAGNFVWARLIGSSGFDMGAGIAVDGDGNIYTSGQFRQTADFDPGAGVFSLTSAGGDDIFAAKLDSAGNFVWARAMGGSTNDVGAGIAVQGDNLYVTGVFSGTADLDPGNDIVNPTSNGDRDAFVVNLTSSPPAVPPVITSGGIVVANLLPTVNTISPLSIISVFGENFSTLTILYPNLDGDGKLATILGGTCLMMNGEALPIFAVTPGQINAQVSAEKTYGPASFTVVTNCGSAAALTSAPLLLESGTARELTSGVETVTVEAATPSFFIFNPVAANGLIAARFNATASQNAAAVAPVGMFDDAFGPSRPAKPGEIIVLYGTGWGSTTATLTAGELASGAAEMLPEANPKITFGGIEMSPIDVLYVGITPSSAGLYQTVIRVPATAQDGNNQVVLTVYGKSTPVGPVVPVTRTF